MAGPERLVPPSWYDLPQQADKFLVDALNTDNLPGMQLVRGLSFVLMFTLVPMVVQRAPVSLPLSRQMMPVTQSNSSMATTFRADPLRFVRTDLPAPSQVLVVALAVVPEADLEADLADVVPLAEVVVASVVALQVAEEASAVVSKEPQEAAMTLEVRVPLCLHHLTHSPTLRQLVRKEAKQSMFAT
jgi:hypothetical protein